MVESGAIDVAPAYQRQFRWDNSKRARLVESVFLGVPVPSLFMATNRDGTWELVDGVQRLSTLIQFAGTGKARERLGLQSPLVLEDLEQLSELNGSTSLSVAADMRPPLPFRVTDGLEISDRKAALRPAQCGAEKMTDRQ